jgi:hypothetical protein
MALSISVAISGAGRLSLDNIIANAAASEKLSTASTQTVQA